MTLSKKYDKIQKRVDYFYGDIKVSNSIVIKGAKEHNLKDISLEIPRDKLVVITGLSGSGK